MGTTWARHQVTKESSLRDCRMADGGLGIVFRGQQRPCTVVSGVLVPRALRWSRDCAESSYRGPMANNPNQLIVLARARAFAVAVHRTVEGGGREIGRVSPGLRNQVLRAAMSIPLNIAEGASKDSRADFARFIGNAIGSANEVEQQLLLMQALRIFTRELDPLLTECREIRMMLYGLRKRLHGTPQH